MRDLLEKLDNISSPVNEQASVNINMNAETPNEVAELMQMMTNAGLSPSR
jgi:spore coat protein CotH